MNTYAKASAATKQADRKNEEILSQEAEKLELVKANLVKKVENDDIPRYASTWEGHGTIFHGEFQSILCLLN